MPDPIVIYGAGDHGQLVAEAAVEAGHTVAGFLDDAVPPGTTVGQWTVLPVSPTPRYHIAIGDNASRHRVAMTLLDHGHTLVTIVHPTAWISPSAELGDGVFVGPRAVVHTEAAVGLAAIINTAAVVEHHNTIGAAAHIAPHATLCGRVHVGDRTLIGAGATVLPGTHIGHDVTLGANSVARQNLPDSVTAVGNPLQIK